MRADSTPYVGADEQAAAPYLLVIDSFYPTKRTREEMSLSFLEVLDIETCLPVLKQYSLMWYTN